MRDLTEEETALAPDWATHYYAYNDGDILFECNIMYQYYDAKKKEFHDPIGCLNVSDESVEIIRKQLDITQHEWSDERLSHDGNSLQVEYEQWGDHLSGYSTEYLYLDLNRDDAIAIAKHFKITAEDLK